MSRRSVVSFALRGLGLIGGVILIASGACTIAFALWEMYQGESLLGGYAGMELVTNLSFIVIASIPILLGLQLAALAFGSRRFDRLSGLFALYLMVMPALVGTGLLLPKALGGAIWASLAIAVLVAGTVLALPKAWRLLMAPPPARRRHLRS